MKTRTKQQLCSPQTQSVEHSSDFTEQNQDKLIGFGCNFGGTTPTPISELTNKSIKRVVAGCDHVIVWDDERNVFARGRNSRGQLGLGHFDGNHQNRFVREWWRIFLRYHPQRGREILVVGN